MSTLHSKNTSFDPMDWYKKLTTCLASKKNCKINLSRVPGGKEIKDNKRLPSKKITSQNLQNKFLAKYNEKRQQLDPEDYNSEQKLVPLGFNLQQKNQNAMRKKPDDIINLPSTYFKLTNVPDLSIFKIPQIPPAKKQKLEKATNALSNFTLDSLFSGNFRPPKASTPVDEMRPIISDPCDVLNVINKSKTDRGDMLEISHEVFQAEKTEEDPKFRDFLDLVDSVALKIDTMCFSKLVDPIAGVLNHLNETHDIVTQSPRSSLYGKSDAVHTETTPAPSRPVPVFYENQEYQEESLAKKIANEYFDSFFDEMSGADSIFPSSLRAKDTTKTYFYNDLEKNSSPYEFETSSQTPSPITIDNQSILMTPQLMQHPEDNGEFNWLDEVFNNSMDFESSTSYSQNNQIENDETNIFIFRSPPTSQQSKKKLLRKKFSHASNNGHNLSNNSSVWSNQSFDNDSVFDISLDLH